jgi:protein TonB
MRTLRLIFVVVIVTLLIGLQSNAQENLRKIFIQVDTMPQYPGKNEALLKDITSMVKYPEEARKKSITGKIYVTFIVSKTGKIESTAIARGVGPLLDKEALTVINTLNKTWKPGIKDGKPVNVSIVILFDFKEDGKIDVNLPDQKKLKAALN